MSGIGGARVRFPASVFRILKTGALTIQQIFDLSSLTANRTVTMPDKNGTLAMTSDIAAAADVPDNTFRISDNGDSTKKIAFEASGIDASTVRTFTSPNRNHTLGGVELWATATKYIIGDVVGISYLGSVRFYRCTTAHTAAAAFTTDVATNWTLIAVMNFEEALFALMQTADPTKKSTFDLSLLTASRSITVPDKAGTMAMLSDITTATVTDTPFLYRQALLNANFDLWERGATSFTNPATAIEFANNWKVRKSNGGGTAPSINISQDTTIYSKYSKYSCKLDVTAAGTANATTQYEVYQAIKDFERFQGQSISISMAWKGPTASENIDFIIDDGVQTTLKASKTVTTSFTIFKFENISINSAATKLEIIARIAGGTGLSIPSGSNFIPSTTGAFYFGQCQLNLGTLAIDFKPYSKSEERSLSPVSYAVIRDEKAANTGGGTFTSGAWRTRDLNTKQCDVDGIVSIASNQFTLEPGRYRIRSLAPAHGVDRHKTKLYNITDSTDSIIGASCFCNSPSSADVNALVDGEIQISKTTVFEIQHQCQNSKATNGFGFESNMGVVEVYTQVEIWKLS